MLTEYLPRISGKCQTISDTFVICLVHVAVVSVINKIPQQKPTNVVILMH